MAPDLATATGTESVAFTPDQRVCELVFRNWVNRPATAADGSSSTITNAAVDGAPVTPRVEPGGAPGGAPGTLVTLPLPRCVEAGTTVRADLGFRIALGADSEERIGHSIPSRTAWMGTAMPLLAWVRGEGWVRDPAVRMSGETVVGEDFRLERAAGHRERRPGRRGHRNADRHVHTRPRPDDAHVHRGRRARRRRLRGRLRDHRGTQRGHPDPRRRPALRRPVHRQRSGPTSTCASSTKLQALLGPYPYPDLWATVSPTLSDGIEFPTHLQYGDVRERRPARRSSPTSSRTSGSTRWSATTSRANPWLDESFATYAQAVVSDQRDEYRLRDPTTPTCAAPIGAPMSFWDDPRRVQRRTPSASTTRAPPRSWPAGTGSAPSASTPPCAPTSRRTRTGSPQPSDVEAAFRDLPQVTRRAARARRVPYAHSAGHS